MELLVVLVGTEVEINIVQILYSSSIRRELLSIVMKFIFCINPFACLDLSNKQVFYHSTFTDKGCLIFYLYPLYSFMFSYSNRRIFNNKDNLQIHNNNAILIEIKLAMIETGLATS